MWRPSSWQHGYLNSFYNIIDIRKPSMAKLYVYLRAIKQAMNRSDWVSIRGDIAVLATRCGDPTYQPSCNHGPGPLQRQSLPRTQQRVTTINKYHRCAKQLREDQQFACYASGQARQIVDLQATTKKSSQSGEGQITMLNAYRYTSTVGCYRIPSYFLQFESLDCTTVSREISNTQRKAHSTSLNYIGVRKG